MAYRVSYRWVQQAARLGSWTENFWNSSADLTQVKSEAAELKGRLALSKGDQAYCLYYRISLLNKFRATEVVRIASARPRGGNNFPGDYPTTKLQIKMNCALGTTTQWLGGLPDDWVTKGGFYIPVGDSTSSLSAIFAELVLGANSWSCRLLNPDRPTFIIKSIDRTTGLVTTNANTLAQDSQVRIKGVRTMTAANGVWRITVLTNTTFTLNGWLPQTLDMTKGNPTVRPQDYSLSKISTCRVNYATSHKVGKLPDQLSGQTKSR